MDQLTKIDYDTTPNLMFFAEYFFMHETKEEVQKRKEALQSADLKVDKKREYFFLTENLRQQVVLKP